MNITVYLWPIASSDFYALKWYLFLSCSWRQLQLSSVNISAWIALFMIFGDRKVTHLLIIEISLPIFAIILLKCFFHDNLLSTITPRILMSGTWFTEISLILIFNTGISTVWPKTNLFAFLESLLMLTFTDCHCYSCTETYMQNLKTADILWYF